VAASLPLILSLLDSSPLCSSLYLILPHRNSLESVTCQVITASPTFPLLFEKTKALARVPLLSLLEDCPQFPSLGLQLGKGMLDPHLLYMISHEFRKLEPSFCLLGSGYFFG
jgi:hypothetical protein